jgi:hypothetical protein
MSLLKPAANRTAFIKVGIFGFEGSGKTRTAAEIAIGLTKQIGGTKVAFFDTEKGSDFHVERFKSAGIELFSHKSRAFIDLCDIIREAERGGYSFLIIDSITHVWRELVDSYLKKSSRKFLSMKDWGILKTEWTQFTDLYVNSKLHIAMLGRAGHQYETEVDENGKDQIHKSGTKMKAESEAAYEPDLLLEMLRVPLSKENGDPDQHGFVNRCVVLKDRTDQMNGTVIDFPKFENFAPVISALNLGGVHLGADLTRTSEGMFSNSDRSYVELAKRKEIAIEELADLVTLAGLNGTSKESVAQRTRAMVDIFGGSGSKYIESLELTPLQVGIEKFKTQFHLNKPAAVDAIDQAL